MSWVHVTGTGAQVTAGSQATLSATLSGTIAAGDLIVVSVVWSGAVMPTVQDSVNSVNYIYVGPNPSSGNQVGTWYYVASSGGSGFTVTVTSHGGSFMAMAVDAYTLTSGFIVSVDSSLYSTGSSTTPVLSAPLSVSSSDLIYASCAFNGTSGVITPGTGFTLRYTAQFVGGTAYGIGVQDYVNESSAITPGFSTASSIPWSVNGIAFKTALYTATLTGPSSGALGLPSQFYVSLNSPAGSGGQVVSFASTQGGDIFTGTFNGSTVSSITIPSGEASGTFWLVPSSTTGSRNITITVSGAVISYQYGGSSFTYNEGTVANQYFLDNFAGSAGTLLTAHTSDSGASWPSNSTYTYGATPFQLDGNGMIYTTSLSNGAQAPSVSLPVGNIEINYTIKDFGGGYGSGSLIAGMMIYADSPLGSMGSFLFLGAVTQYGTSWFTNGFTGAQAPGFSGTLAMAIGTLYHFKIKMFRAYGIITLYFYYSIDGTTWLQQGQYASKSFSIPASPITIGPIFAPNGIATPMTATTGIHIGSLAITNILTPSPTSVVDHAYVASSGESIAVFFKNSGGAGVAPQFLLSLPTIYKNGVSIGDLSSATPWIDTTALPMIFPLPTPVSGTDVITLSAPASWILLSDQSTVQSISGLSVVNNVGKSCFGADSLTRTLKVGVNISAVGCMYGNNDAGYVFKNLLSRIPLPGVSPGLPTTLASGGQSFTFMFMGQPGNEFPGSFATPASLGYYAIGYDDAYIANSGSPTPQLAITSLQLPTVVTQVTSCDNHGTNGIGQYYLFNVTSTGLDVNSRPSFGVYLNLTYPPGSTTTYVQNIHILAPGEFTFTLGTPLTFDRSNPRAVSNSLNAKIPSGVGTMRFADAFNYLSQAVDSWECRNINDVAWTSQKFSTTITATSMRPFLTSTSPYLYGELWGSSWTAISSPLSSSMTNSQTTITMAYAQTECYVSGTVGAGQAGNPLFYGLTLAIGGQGGSGTLEYMRIMSVSGTSVTVVRGFAFNGTLTPAVAHGAGEIISIGNRYAWTTLGSLGNFFGGPGHQTVEIVCSSPHMLHSGQNVQIPFASAYSATDTNGNTVASMGAPLALIVTGPNTFVMSWWNSAKNSYGAATLASTYTFSPAVTYTFTLPGGQMPFEAGAELTNYFNCDIHANLPMLASDGFIFEKAQMFLSKLTPGRRITIELGDEPGIYYWMQWVGQAFAPMLGQPAQQFYFYIKRVDQVNAIFSSVFTAAGRGGEFLRFANCTGSNNVMTLAQANVPPIKIDYWGVAPYLICSRTAATNSFNSNSTPNQSADLFIHQVYYLPNTGSVTSGNPANPFSAVQANIASYNTATGFNCKLYSYEGGYQVGCSTDAAGPKGSGWFNYRLSSDIRYLPVWRTYEKDFFALCQVGGFERLTVYSLYLYPYAQSHWLIYAHMAQDMGMGDGSDGKYDNRKVLESVGFTGPNYVTQGYLGVGVGSVSVTSGGTTVTFSQSWAITKGLTWITIDGDPHSHQFFLVSGSGLGPWTIYSGVNPPGNNTYEGPTDGAATYVYGTAVSQDNNTVSVRGKALAEWNNFGGAVASHYALTASTGIG